MIIKPFEQWRIDMLASLEPEDGEEIPDVDVDCPDCNGEGEVECDCDCSRCDADMPCDRCNGEGTISSLDLGRDELDKALFSRTEYLEALTAELVKLAQYTGNQSLAPLIDAGMAPYMTMPRRTEDGRILSRSAIMLHDHETGREFRPKLQSMQ